MCGICGFIGSLNISKSELKKMNDTMIHRGPNDSGEEVFEIAPDFRVGLAQRRLAILDLSSLGHQPMHSFDNSVSVVFNGEIYNYKELKEQLNEYPFKSNCDTEVIIAAYQRWGIECIKKFNGMFAIVIFDHRDNTLYLIRDRMGQKPLYYLESKNEDYTSLIFASELKAIMAYSGFQKEINNSVITEYLFHGYICSPQTIFSCVYQVEPGTYIKLTDGYCQRKEYWNVYEEFEKGVTDLYKSFEEAKEQLKTSLINSIKLRLVADVPVGLFLSGGIDSSLITAIAQSTTSTPIKTFCIGFEEKSYNEALHAKKIANYLGTEHTELYISDNEMQKLVQTIPYYYDEPFADSSEIPTMLVSSLAKEQVTVALTGDAGDEFFCGYNTYDIVLKLKRLESLGKIVHYIGLINSVHGKIEDIFPRKVKIVADNSLDENKTQFYDHRIIKLLKGLLGDNFDDTRIFYREKTTISNLQVRRMLLDMNTYLPNDILTKVDRASMKYSLEARSPFLDYNVIKTSFRIPHSFKYHNGIKKAILKNLVYDYIPKALLERPKKGFSVPIEKWLKQSLKELLISYSDPVFLQKQGIFEPLFTHNLICSYLNDKQYDRYGSIIWSFLIFQQWYCYWMK